MTIKVKLLDRYIGQQLIMLFIGTVALLASLGVALGNISDLTYKISEYNLPLLVALQIFLLKIPEYTAYALPIALLLTTLVVYGRLNKNSELIACYSSSISVYSIVTPAILLSIFITLFNFLLTEFIMYPANEQVAVLENQFITQSNLDSPEKDIFYPEYTGMGRDNLKLTRLYYAQIFEGDRFKKIIIINWHKSQIQNIIVAEEAIWNQEAKIWNFINGRIENFANNSYLSSKNQLDLVKIDFFSHKKLLLPSTFFKIAKGAKDPQAMSLSQARQYLKLIINSNDQAKIRLLQVRIQQKLAFPFICLVFGLIGSSIGITFSQTNRGQGFGICVGIAFSYYVIGLIVGSCGIVGLISPVVAGWLPNFLGWVIGGWLLYCNNSS